jgi:hypothetical protein
MKYLRQYNLNSSNIFDNTVLQRADGNIELNPSQKVIINGGLEFPPGAAIPGPEVTNIMYVTLDGDDHNSGYGEGPTQAKRTIKSALASAQQGTTIYVRSGEYYEDNPLRIPPKVSIVGDNLRRTILRPLNGPLEFAISNVERTDQMVTITTATPHGLKPKDRVRIRANIGTAVTAGNFEIGKKYRILLVSTTDFKAIGSPYNTKGTLFIATGPGLGTGTAYLAEVDENDVNIFDVPSPTTFRYRQFGENIASVASTGKVLEGIDFFYCNSQTYIAQLVFKGLRAPAYAVNIDSDAIVDTSPYVQNCSNINGPWMRNGEEWLPFITKQPDLTGTMVTGPRPLLDDEIDPTQVDQFGIDIEGGGGGMLIDGDRYSPLSPIKSMVGDAFTQVSQGGIGFHITNFGYMQLVSCFAVFCSIGFYTTRGGYLSISNSVVDFGTQGFLADGYYLDPYSVGKMPIDYYSTVGSITINSPGTSFLTPPVITIEPPDMMIEGARAATANVSLDPFTGRIDSINVDDPGFGYDFVPEITITPSNGAVATANLQKNLNIKVDKLSNKPQVGSIIFLGNDPTAYYIASTIGDFISLEYDEIKCRRDADIILNGIYFDVTLGTNYNAIVNGLSYRRAMASEVIDTQLEATLGALTFLKSRAAVILASDSTALNRSNLAFDEIIEIVQNGPNQADPATYPPPDGVSFDIINAVIQLQANKEFIKAEIIAWVNENLSIVGSYNENTCARDVGYMIDAFCYDIMYGGNSATITVAESYFEGVVSVLPNDQKADTALAIGRLGEVCGQVVQEISVITSTGNTEVQDFSNEPASATEATLVESLADIIKDAINLDDLSGLPNKVLPGVSWVDPITLNVANIFLSNIPTTIEEMIDYIERNFVKPFKYDQQKCSRDIGYIVNAALADAVLGSDQQSVYAGLAYLRSYSSKVTSLQKSQTIAGITKAKELTSALTLDPVLQNKILDGFNVVENIINFGTVAAPSSVTLTPTTVRRPGYAEAAAILVANKSFLQEEITTWFENNFPVFTYDEAKCRRDVGLILNAVLDDIVFESNYRSVYAGLSYLRSYADVVTGQQKAQTIAGINKARDLAIALVTDDELREEIEETFKIITDIIQKGNDLSIGTIIYTDATGIGSTDTNNAARVLQANKEFIKAEIIAWINFQIINNISPFEGFIYNSTKCSRDIGYLVDALTYDLIYGGNSQTIAAANTYYLGLTSVIPGQEVQSVAAFTRLKNIISDIVTNTPITPTSGNLATQDTNLSPGTIGTGSTLQDLIDIINDIVDDGVSTTVEILPTYSSAIFYDTKNNDRLTILAEEEDIKDNVILFLNAEFSQPYNETTCRRDISYIIDAIAYDLTYEGNSQTTNAALSYADGNVLGKEIEETQKAYEYWKTIIDEIVKNQLITPSQGNLVSQNILLPLGSPLDSSGPAKEAQNLLQIIINVIDHGTGYVPDPIKEPKYSNANNPAWLSERDTILLSLSSIQQQTIAFLNQEYGGRITIETFPPVTSVVKDTEVKLYNVSTISTASTAMEYVGSGVTYNALPFFGGEPEPINERVEINQGKCFTVTSDQVGNYKIGEFFTVNALTGEITIDAEKLNLSGLASIGPFRRNGIPVGVVLREVSNNPNLVSSTGSVDANTAPTQQAVASYVELRYLNKITVDEQSVAGNVTFNSDVKINGGDLTTDQTTFNLINTVAETVNFAGDADNITIGSSTSNVVLQGDLEVQGGDLTTNQTTFNLVNTVAETVNFAGNADDINIGSNTGELIVNNPTVTFANATTFNINGNDPIVNSDSNGTLSLFDTTITEVFAFRDADDITIGSLNSNVILQGDLEVQGGDLTTDKVTFNLINTVAETVNFAGNADDINIGSNSGDTTVHNNFDVVQNTVLGADTDSVTTINGKLTVSLKDNESTILNFTESTDSYFKIDTTNGNELITFGSTPKLSILNTTESTNTTTGSLVLAGGLGVAKNVNIGGNLDVSGNSNLGNERTVDIHTLTGTTSFDIPDNTTVALQIKENTQPYLTAVTTNGSESITIESTPKLLVKNTTESTTSTTGSVIIDGGVGIAKTLNVGLDINVTGDLAVNGGDITTNQTTFNLLNTTATTVNFAGDGTAVTIGATTGTLTLRNSTIVGTETTQNLFNTVATTINFAGDSTTLTIGATTGTATLRNATVVLSGDLEVQGGDIITNQTTFNLLNTTATTVNFAGAGTSITIGATTGTLTVKNTETVFDSTSHITIPVGTTLQRPNPAVAGMIRYNTELSTFEGYATAWGSLGGVKDVDGNTYIIPETSPGANENILYFYNDGTLTLTLSETEFDLKAGVDAVISSTTASTSKTTGALTVVGGVGVGGAINANELTLTIDLEVAHGGTGQSSFTTNGIIYGQNTSALAVTAASNPGSNATTSYGILTTDVSNVPVWTDTIDGGSY